jgi:hypothetical protein
MNIREISKPVTAKSLNESLAKKFGAKVNVDAFTNEQLEDARNKIRTKLFQVETNESFDTVVKDEGYQKSKLFLDVLNAAISERNIAEKMDPVGQEDDDINNDGKKDSSDEFLKKRRAAIAKSKTKTKESIVREEEASPEERLKALSDLYNVVMDNIKRTEEIMYMTPPGMNRDQYEQEVAQMQKRAAGIKKDAQALKAGMQGADDIRAKATESIVREGATKSAMMADAEKMSKAAFIKKYGKENAETWTNMNESIVREGAEDQAELVMAAKDMVDRLTGWMEDTAEMQTESMLELADAVRDEMGSEQSEAFVGAVKPALESLYAAMEVTRGALTAGVGQLTGEAEPVDAMGAEEPEAEMEPTVDAEAEPEMDAEMPADDGMGASAAAAGGEEEAGRAKRESVERSRKLGTILSKKK